MDNYFNEAENLLKTSEKILSKKELSKEDIKMAKDCIAESKALRTTIESEAKVERLPMTEEKDFNSKGKEISEKDAFLQYVCKGTSGMDKKALSSITLSEGGALIADDFRNDLITDLDDILKFRSMATVIQTNKASVSFPVFEYTGTINNVAESGTITAESISDAFGRKTFTPHKKAVLVKIPVELLEDSEPAVEAILKDHFLTRMAEELEDDFINGTGVEESKGILQETTITNVDLGSSASSITGISGVSAILNAPYKLKEQYRRNGAFIMPRQSILEVRDLKDGQNRPIFMPATASLPPVLNGHPVVELERMATPAADGDAVFLFGDLKKYYIVERKSIEVQRLTELYAANGQVGIMMTLRVDGALVDKNAFVRYNRN